MNFSTQIVTGNKTAQIFKFRYFLTCVITSFETLCIRRIHGYNHELYFGTIYSKAYFLCFFICFDKSPFNSSFGCISNIYIDCICQNLCCLKYIVPLFPAAESLMTFNAFFVSGHASVSACVRPRQVVNGSDKSLHILTLHRALLRVPQLSQLIFFLRNFKFYRRN